MKQSWMSYVLAVILIGNSYGCVKDPDSGHVFKVGIRALPKKIDPINNEINIYHYINIHIFYPLFQHNEIDTLESAYLDMHDSQASNEKFSEFKLCLKKDIRFSDETLITSEDLQEALLSAHQKNLELAAIKSISKAGARCVVVSLSKRDVTYFDKLITIQSAILKKSTKSTDFPVGLGPYVIKERKVDRVILKTTQTKIKPYYTEIQFIQIDDPQKGKSEGLHDWNQLWQHLGKDSLIPPEVRSKFKKIVRPLQRSLILVVNIKEQKLRHRFSFCFNKQAYIEFVRLTLIKTPGFIPIGLLGNNADFDKVRKSWGIDHKACQKSGYKPKIKFYHFYPVLDSKIKAFFRQNVNNLPIDIEVQLISVEEAIHRVFNNEELIMPVMADSTQPSSVGFFTFMMGKNKIISTEIKDLMKTVYEAAQSDSDERKEFLFTQAHKMVLDSGYIVPLGQVEATFEFPPEITGMEAIDQINGFPLIHKLMVSR
ncbi:MAG: hypothetical protein HY843_03105 [Bdellovibrio sp.]|nr:hypothetical protein [Bdellovibrio sp.]